MYNSKNPKPLTLGEDREEWLEKILQTTANNGVVGPCPVPRSWAWPMGQDQGHPSNVALWGELARPTQPWWQLGLRPLLRNTHPHSLAHTPTRRPHPLPNSVIIRGPHVMPCLLPRMSLTEPQHAAAGGESHPDYPLCRRGN